jgi:hypothetical protein
LQILLNLDQRLNPCNFCFFFFLKKNIGILKILTHFRYDLMENSNRGGKLKKVMKDQGGK